MNTFLDSLLSYFKIKKSFTPTLILEICSKGIPYLFLPLFLRYMSKSDFAIYSFITFIIVSLSSLLFNSTETVFSVLYHKYEKEKKLNFNLLLIIIISHVCFGIFLFSGLADRFFVKWQNYLPINLNIFKLALILASFTNGYTIMFSKYFAFKKQYRFFQYWNIVRIFSLNFILLALFFIGIIQLNFINRFYFETLVLLFFFIFLFLKWFENQQIKLSIPVIKESMQISLPMLVSSLCFFLNTLADKFILQEHFSISKLASYNLAFVLILPMGLLFTTFFEVIWTPKFFKRKSLEINYRLTSYFLPQYIKSLIKVFPIYLLFVIAVVWISGDWSTYSDVIWLVSILYFVKIFSFSAQFFNNFFLYKRKVIASSTINVTITIFMLIANIYFIPQFSILAAILILLIAEFLKFGIFYLLVSSKYLRA